MHCDEFRQRLMIDPLDTDPAFRGHASICSSCAADAERALAFEARLRAVLAQDADSPAEGNAHDLGSSDRIVRLLLLAPLLMAFVWWWAGSGAWFDPWRDAAEISIEHVANEAALLRGRSGPPVSADSVMLLLRNLGLGRALSLHPSTRVRHAGRCSIWGDPAAHLVVDGTAGLVTALVMPPHPGVRRELRRGQDYDTLVEPSLDATVVLVGLPGEPLEAVAARLGLR